MQAQNIALLALYPSDFIFPYVYYVPSMRGLGSLSATYPKNQ